MALDCKQFELLLADALGDELSNPDHLGFDAHLEACEACRREYQSLSDTLETTRVRLSGAKTMTRNSERQPTVTPSRRHSGWAVVRYAAAIAMAFGAGYALRAMNPATTETGTLAITATAAPDTVQERLVMAHQRAPNASSFAKSMLAVMGSATSHSR